MFFIGDGLGRDPAHDAVAVRREPAPLLLERRVHALRVRHLEVVLAVEVELRAGQQAADLLGLFVEREGLGVHRDGVALLHARVVDDALPHLPKSAARYRTSGEREIVSIHDAGRRTTR